MRSGASTGPTNVAVAGAPALVSAAGDYQAGISRPSTPQHFGLLVTCDIAGTETTWLAGLGKLILRLTGTTTPSDLLPDGPGDLTVTVGVGPRLVAAHGATLPGSEDLPSFAGDESIDPRRRGGDVLLALYSGDPSILAPVAATLLAHIPNATLRWHQRLFRGHGEGMVVRNPLGFLDGVIVPHSPTELDANVWIDPSGTGAALGGGTICVIRRLRLDSAGFAALGTSQQEQVIGRERITGRPLSGGPAHGAVDLEATTPEGEFVIPMHSHVRAAHPAFTGSSLMFRRGYAFDDGLLADGTVDSGLTFICFQNELRTFVLSQQRLDETDDLMKFATPTGSATFLILPGFNASRELALG